MATEKTQCPHCGARYKISKEKIGRKARCKECDKVFRVGDPPPILAEVVPSDPAISIAKPHHCTRTTRSDSQILLTTAVPLATKYPKESAIIAFGALVAFAMTVIYILDPFGTRDKSSSQPAKSRRQVATTQRADISGRDNNSAASKETMAYKMAVINAGGFVKENDITVKRFRYLLDTIDANVKNSRQEVADMTVAGWQSLRNHYGIDMSLLEFMEAANDSVGEETKELGVDYADILTLLVVLTGNQ